METVNNIILLMVCILSLINLIIEIEDVKTYKYELVLKLCFGSIAIGSLSLIFYKHNFLHTIIYVTILVVLLNRLLIRKKK